MQRVLDRSQWDDMQNGASLQQDSRGVDLIGNSTTAGPLSASGRCSKPLSPAVAPSSRTRKRSALSLELSSWLHRSDRVLSPPAAIPRRSDTAQELGNRCVGNFGL